MQSDQFHYLHHKKFECNYGTGGEPLDRLFGTHRMSLDPKDKSYTGGASVSRHRAGLPPPLPSLRLPLPLPLPLPLLFVHQTSDPIWAGGTASAEMAARW